MRLEDHPAIKANWSHLPWTHAGGASPQIHSLDSELEGATIIGTTHPNAQDYLQLTRRQDRATVALVCEDQSLLQNLCDSLSKCAGQTILEIGLREVNANLTLK
jgi:hypothetical protein